MRLFTLAQDSKEIYTGTENACYYKLLKIQSQSTDWAMKYEGYTVKPITAKLKGAQLNKFWTIQILQRFDFDGYDLGGLSSLEKIKEFFKQFTTTQNWNIARVGEQKALIEYLQGLPSFFAVPFEYWEIHELLKASGQMQNQYHTDSQIEKLNDNYWGFLACHILKQKNKKKLPADWELM